MMNDHPACEDYSAPGLIAWEGNISIPPMPGSWESAQVHPHILVREDGLFVSENAVDWWRIGPCPPHIEVGLYRRNA